MDNYQLNIIKEAKEFSNNEIRPFAAEFEEKEKEYIESGGKLIFPLPSLQIVKK